jgi:hypothetical protein
VLHDLRLVLVRVLLVRVLLVRVLLVLLQDLVLDTTHAFLLLLQQQLAQQVLLQVIQSLEGVVYPISAHA